MRAPFVGVGTGRCGSFSLVNVVRACANTKITHELSRYALRWYEFDGNLGNFVRDAKEHDQQGVLFGDVAPYFIKHLEEIREPLRDLKVVCMHRDKALVSRSYLNFMYSSSLLRPQDRRARAETDPENAESVNRFPVIDAHDPLQAWGFYWEMYEKLMADIPDPVLHLDVEDLNDDAKVASLFAFLGIPESDRVYIEKRNWNSMEARLDATGLYRKVPSAL